MDKVIRIEISFTRATLAIMASALLLCALGALLWTSGIVEASPSRQGNRELQDVEGIAAVVGAKIHYQGRLEGANDSAQMTFRLWADATSNAAADLLWEETQTVNLTQGLFNVQLGAITPLSQDIFDGQELWLGVEVASDGEMTPRQEILPVPYAMSLRPGATIAKESVQPILEIENSGTGPGMQVTGGSYGITASSGSGTALEGISSSGTGVYGSSLTGAALYGFGDVKQTLAGDGLVKAAVFAYCHGTSAELRRSFNNVNASSINITGGGSSGRCTIDFGFDISERYWTASAVLDNARIVNCVLGTSNTELDCYRFSLAGPASGEIMVLIY